MMARQRNQEKLSSFPPWKHEMWVWENQLRSSETRLQDKLSTPKVCQGSPHIFNSDTKHSMAKDKHEGIVLDSCMGHKENAPQWSRCPGAVLLWSSLVRFQRQATESVNCISIQSSFPSGMQKNTSIPKCLFSFQKLPSMQRSKK